MRGWQGCRLLFSISYGNNSSDRNQQFPLLMKKYPPDVVNFYPIDYI